MKVSSIVTILIALAVTAGIGFLIASGWQKNVATSMVAGEKTDIIQQEAPSTDGPTESPTIMPTVKPIENQEPEGKEELDTRDKGPYKMEIDTKKTYTAILTTTAGAITIELNAAKTPITVNNFVVLAKKNFYNNTIFHRVIKGFMIQGGDPDGNGTGGPGYTFADESFDGEYARGTVAMANSGPNTNGSQFFIMHQDNPLPKNYVIFGKVINGMDVVDTIATAQTTISSSGENSKPITPVVVSKINIEVKE